MRPTLQYSYGACGAVDRYSPTSLGIRQRLINLTIRATVPYTDSPTTHFWRTSASGSLQNDGPILNGPVPIMLTAMAAEFGVNIRLHHMSSQSLAAYPNNSWNACRREVAIGAVDLCIGDFWTTRETHLLLQPRGTHTQPFSATSWHLVVSPSVTGATSDWQLRDAFSLIVDPFTWDGWLGAFGIVLLHAVAYWFAEVRCARTMHGLQLDSSSRV